MKSEELPKERTNKEKIVQFLMENTMQENRYIGGGEEPSIITLRNSEDFGYSDDERMEWLSGFADELLKQLEHGSK